MHDKLRHLPRLGMGDAQKIYGVTARALRFYEERGLLTPHRDRTNCRFFDGEARRRLGWIAALRAAGVSLPDIGQVLEAEERDGRGREVACEKLAARRRALASQADAVESLMLTLGSGGDAFDQRSSGLASAA
jgi:DNA-binding transcriptional MerR regulator